MNPPIKVGDRLFVVNKGYSGRFLERWATVTKIGRKWADLQFEGRASRHRADRFDMETMELDGGDFTSPGRVYRSKEEWRWEARDERLWKEFHDAIRHLYKKPANVNDVAIFKAAEALGIRLKGE